MSSRQGRTLIVVLVCSIAINLLLVGGIVGRFISGPDGRPFPSHLGWIMSDLDEETRMSLRPVLKRHASAAKPLRHEMRQAQKALESVLTEEPWNEAQVKLAFEKLQQVSMVNQENLHQQMREVMQELKPSERIKALRYLHVRERGRHRQQRGRPPREP